MVLPSCDRAGLYYPRSEAEWDLTVRANLAYQPLVEGYVG